MKRIYTALIPLALCVLMLCGCPAELKITARSSGEFSAEFSSTLGQELVGGLKELTAAATGLTAEQVSATVGETLKAAETEGKQNAPYLSNMALKMQNGTFTARADVNDIGAFPAEFVSLEKPKKGKTRLSLTFSADALSAMSKKMLRQSPKGETFVESLAAVSMAPIATGEEMSADEYRGLLEGIYGAAIANAMLSGDFTITFVCPDGSVQRRSVSVAEFLTSTKPRTFVFEY